MPTPSPTQGEQGRDARIAARGGRIRLHNAWTELWLEECRS